MDVPHLRSLESAVAGDFDLLAGQVMAGGQPLVVRGFALETTNAINAPATTLQLIVAGGVILHPLASESGTMFAAADDAAIETLSITNTKVIGGFTASAANFVGLDLRRTADDTTSDVVMFLDVNTRLQSPRTIPLARTLDFRIVISTTDFAATPHVCPLAKVTTNSSNAVTAIEDARNMLFRLGRGGSNPNITYSFPWLAGRHETASSFVGGDKQLGSLKDMLDAMTSRLWELGGGQYWSSATSDRDIKLVKGSPLLGTGDNFAWTLGSQTLEWKSLSFAFANTDGWYNDVADGTVTPLISGECLYVDVDRTANRSGGTALVPAKASLLTLGSPTVPGSRFIIAWRKGDYIFVRDRDYEVGRPFAVATTTTQGTVKLAYAPASSGDPIVPPLDVNGRVSATATANNSAGFFGTGHGTGAGVSGTGGASSGSGVKGVGGAANGLGVRGEGTGTGAGGSFLGGSGASASGVIGFGGSVAGSGVVGIGNAAGTWGVSGIAGVDADAINGAGNGIGAGVNGVGGATSGSGVKGTGGGGGAGVEGIGGPTNGVGVTGVGGSAGGIGIVGTGTSAAGGILGVGGPSGGSGITGTGVGVGSGVVANAGASGVALNATGGSVGGALITVTGTTVGNAVSSSALRMRNSTTTPSTGTKVMAAWLHAAADGFDDGVGLWSTRIAEDLTKFTLGKIVDNVATEQIHFDFSAKTIYPDISGDWSIASFDTITAVSKVIADNATNSIQMTTQHLDLSAAAAAPSSTTAVANKLNKRNICKAWARIRILREEPVTPGISVHYVTLEDGFNVNTAVGTDPGIAIELIGGQKYLRIGWAADFLDTNYVVTYSIEHENLTDLNFGLITCAQNFSPSGANKTTGKVYLLPVKTDVAATIFDLNTLTISQPIYINIVAFGQQA